MPLQQQPMQTNPYVKKNATAKAPGWAPTGGEPTVQNISQQQPSGTVPFQSQGLHTARGLTGTTIGGGGIGQAQTPFQTASAGYQPGSTVVGAYSEGSPGLAARGLSRTTQYTGADYGADIDIAQQQPGRSNRPKLPIHQARRDMGIWPQASPNTELGKTRGAPGQGRDDGVLPSWLDRWRRSQLDEYGRPKPEPEKPPVDPDVQPDPDLYSGAIASPQEDNWNKVGGTDFSWLGGGVDRWGEHDWGKFVAAYQGKPHRDPVTGITTNIQSPAQLYEAGQLTQEQYEAAQTLWHGAHKTLTSRLSALNAHRRKRAHTRSLAEIARKELGGRPGSRGPGSFTSQHSPTGWKQVPENLQDEYAKFLEYGGNARLSRELRSYLYDNTSATHGSVGDHKNLSMEQLGWSQLRSLAESDNFSQSESGNRLIYETYAGGGHVKPRGYAGGGAARGTDTVPAMLTPGEFVMSRGAVNQIGIPNLMAMNSAGGGDNKPRFGVGGVYARGGGVVPRLRRSYYAAGGPVQTVTPGAPQPLGTTPSAIAATAAATTQGLSGTTALKPQATTEPYRFPEYISPEPSGTDIGKMIKAFQSNNLAGLSSAYQQAMDAANAANESRFGNIMNLSGDLYGRSMDRVGQLGQDQIAESRKAYDESLAGMQARLGTRGLSGTTVGPSLQQGIDRSYQDAVRGIQENTLKQQLQTDIDLTRGRMGVMERRTDQGPNFSELLGITQAMAAGGQGEGYPGSEYTASDLGGGGPNYGAYGNLTPWDAPLIDYNKDGKVNETDKKWAESKEEKDKELHEQNIRKGIYPGHWGKPPSGSTGGSLKEWIQKNEKRDQAGAFEIAKREAEAEKAEGAPDRYEAWQDSTSNFEDDQQEYLGDVQGDASRTDGYVSGSVATGNLPDWVSGGSAGPQPSVGDWDNTEMEAEDAEKVDYSMPSSWGKPPYALKTLYEVVPSKAPWEGGKRYDPHGLRAEYKAAKKAGNKAKMSQMERDWEYGNSRWHIAQKQKVVSVSSWVRSSIQSDPGSWLVGEAGYKGWQTWYANQQAEYQQQQFAFPQD